MSAAPDTCSTCKFWSKYLPALGECMVYAYKRRLALQAADTEDLDEVALAWPARPARDTEATDTCDDWTKKAAA